MLRQLVFILLLTATVLDSTALAAPPPQPTQRDLMIELVDGLGWTFGLPDTPSDDDYLLILSGQRRLRLEVETMVGNDTPLIPKEIFTFGNFSGEGWLRGAGKPSRETLAFILPLAGTYTIKTRILQGDFALQFGSTRLTAENREERLEDIACGRVTLEAGRQEVVVDIPSRGGIDFIELESFPASPIAPLNGWQLDAPLTTADLATVALKVLELQALLPRNGEPTRIEAEELDLTQGMLIQQDNHHGEPSAGGWVRAGASVEPTAWYLTISPPAGAGMYALTVSSTSREEILGLFNDRVPLHLPATNSLQPVEAGAFYLHPGENRLKLTIPPLGGIDYFELTPLDDSAEARIHLAGLNAQTPVSQADLDKVIRLLATFAVRR